MNCSSFAVCIRICYSLSDIYTSLLPLLLSPSPPPSLPSSLPPSALPYFQDFSLSASARLALGSSYAASGEKEGEGEGEEEEGVVFAGHALFCAAEGKWREAVKLADKGDCKPHVLGISIPVLYGLWH